ncbi:unnamed protein product, partial [Choristocarpus tenellus]
QCKKVYHPYCLGFNVGDQDLVCCPRHACDICGNTSEHFCRFCPVSLCTKHYRYRYDVMDFVAKTGKEMLVRVKKDAIVGGGDPPASESTSSGCGRGGKKRSQCVKSSKKAKRRRCEGLQAGGGKEAAATASPARKQGRGGMLRGLGNAGDGWGWEGREFVCWECYGFARRAVRQYGLLRTAEMEGVVLPYAESEGSGDESEVELDSEESLIPSQRSPAVRDGTGDGNCREGEGGGGITP